MEITTPYHPDIWQAWEDKTILKMPFFGDKFAEWQIFGLDFGYDVAELVCISGSYQDLKQSVSLKKLLKLLNGDSIGTVTFRYVCRWYDSDRIPHYFGVYSKYSTLKEARRNIIFSMIDVEPDLVYQPENEEDMFAYLADVNQDRDDNDDEQLGTTLWLE